MQFCTYFETRNSSMEIHSVFQQSDIYQKNGTITTVPKDTKGHKTVINIIHVLLISYLPQTPV